MPFRLLLYIVEIWRDIYNNTLEEERERKEFRPPAVIPAVLCNGANSWTATLNFKEILAGYQQFRKHAVEELYRAANLIFSVFVLDQRIRAGELIGRLHRLANGIKNLSRDEFRRFVICLAHMLKARLPEPLQETDDGIIDEVNPFHRDRVGRLTRARKKCKGMAQAVGMFLLVRCMGIEFAGKILGTKGWRKFRLMVQWF